MEKNPKDLVRGKLETLSLAYLKRLMSELNISGRSKFKRKDEIIDQLTNNHYNKVISHYNIKIIHESEYINNKIINNNVSQKIPIYEQSVKNNIKINPPNINSILSKHINIQNPPQSSKSSENAHIENINSVNTKEYNAISDNCINSNIVINENKSAILTNTHDEIQNINSSVIIHDEKIKHEHLLPNKNEFGESIILINKPQKTKLSEKDNLEIIKLKELSNAIASGNLTREENITELSPVYEHNKETNNDNQNGSQIPIINKECNIINSKLLCKSQDKENITYSTNQTNSEITSKKGNTKIIKLKNIEKTNHCGFIRDNLKIKDLNYDYVTKSLNSNITLSYIKSSNMSNEIKPIQTYLNAPLLKNSKNLKQNKPLYPIKICIYEPFN